MKALIRQFTVIAASVLMSAASCAAGKLVLILHPGADWRVLDAEKISINGKNKVRQGAQGDLQLTSDVYKTMMQIPIGALPMRLHRGGYLVVKTAGGAWIPAAPDGASPKTATSFSALWASAAVQVQPDSKSKPAEYRPADVWAILPGQNAMDAAVDFLSDASNFTGVGEKYADEAFDERMSLLIGVSTTATGSASVKLRAMLSSAMDSALQRASSGTDRYAAILQGLRYAAVSEKAFPTDPEQKKLRDSLYGKKTSLDQRRAILKALSAGSEWDAFIDKYGDFEQYDSAFEDVRKLREVSFTQSFAAHMADAKKYQTEKDFTPCMREVQLALQRNPADKDAQNLLEICRIGEPATHPGSKEEKIPVATLRLIVRSLTLAESYIGDGKLREAEGEIVAAEALSKTYPAITYTRAELYRARKDFPKALEALNSYDKMVSADADVAKGEALRAKILYETRTGKENFKTGITRAMADGDYLLAMKNATGGLQIDPEDVDFLYFAGVNSAILRNEKDSVSFLNKYLKVALPTTESKRRAEAFSFLQIIGAAKKPSSKNPNWFSGTSCSAGLMYCPDGLMPDAHPYLVKASHKQTASFEWNGGLLNSIKTVSMEQGAGEVDVYFDYFGAAGGVRRVNKSPFDDKDKDASGTRRFTAEGTVGDGKGTYLALFSDPVVSPWMVEKLTGKRVATVVAGNPWFVPFVWDGIYEFLAEYDADGRVVSAKQLQPKAGQDRVLAFTWDGDRLMSIAERGGEGYRRDMKYSGEKIVSEAIHWNGKTSKIEYKYQGERLTEADCDQDPSLDSRSRHVSFTN